MGIRERFFKRSQTKDIPSGAYEDYLETKLTGKPSYPEIDGPRTLVDAPPEREKELVQQEKINPAWGDSVDTPEKLTFDPTTLDRRVYDYIQQVAMPAMMESESVLFYLQKAIDEGMFGNEVFAEDVESMIQIIDALMNHLSEAAASSFMRLDEADEVDGVVSKSDIERWKEAYEKERGNFKGMLEKIGDPFAEHSKTDPFSSTEIPDIQTGEFGDVEKPERITEDELWDMKRKNRDGDVSEGSR